MMALFIFSLGTSFTFLLGELFVIPLIMRPLFLSALGPTMLETLRLTPALLFYIIHVAGLVWFAGRPFMVDDNKGRAGLNGALLGLVAYSCYEMTSWTIMRDWNIGLVIIDILWGALISGLSALVGAVAVQKWRAKF